MVPQPETLVGLIDQLGAIAEPAPVSMAPATPAWAVLALVLVAAAALGLLAWIRHRRATAYRRAALKELRALAPAIGQGDPTALASLDILLRRTALAAFPRAEVASLTGPAWIAFLDRTGGALAPHGPALTAAPYARTPPAFDGPAVLGAARHWLRHHHA